MKRIVTVALLVSLAVPVAATAAAPTAATSIVGGRDARAQDWPSIAFLLSAWDVDGDGDLDGSAGCTGTVVKAEWILTAAHCGFRPDDRPVDAMLSITGVADHDDPIGEERFADRLVVHPGWDPATLLGDAMLMHLEQPSSRPAMPLARPAIPYRSDPAVPNAAGWGLVDEAATRDTTVLQEAYLRILGDGACRGYDPTYDAATQTCAFTERVAGVCQGDSGGPLTVLDASGVRHLWGVTSYGTQTLHRLLPCSLRAPAVFSRVPAYASWIGQEIGEILPAPPGPAAAQAGPATPLPTPADETAPVLSRAKLSARRFKAARRGATITRRTGAKLSFTLSEAAAVRVTVLRGRRALGPTASIAGQAGRTTRRFTGRLGAKALKPRRYKLQLGAVDAAGNAARPVRLRFRIVR